MQNAAPSDRMKYLWTSMGLFVLFCIMVFFIMTRVLTDKSSDALNQVGETYMEKTSHQLKLNLHTLIELKISQMENMSNQIPVSERTLTNSEAIRARLAESAALQGFEYIAFMSPDGKIEKIYGDDLYFYDANALLANLNNDESKIGTATDSKGDSLIVLGISVVYPMESGEESTAIICGLPVEYISDKLELEENMDEVYSFIVRKDGSFVFRTKSVTRNNYFDRVRDLYEENEGHTRDGYIKAISEAMARQEDYSDVFWINGEKRRLYLTKLGYSDWYLISFMPFGDINRTIDDLTKGYMQTAINASLAMLAVLILVFGFFLYINKQYVSTLEAAQREAVEANRAKSDFLSRMSHDIRTPMNAILGMSAIARKDINNPEHVDSCLGKIEISGNHMLGLINNILDMSKIESGKLVLSRTANSVRAVFEDVVVIVGPQADAKKQKLELNIHDIENDSVLLDRLRFHQIVINLATNAVKYTQDKGSITLEVYENACPDRENHTELNVIVKDNGMGMSEEFLEHIFDAFVREDSERVGRENGAGLGMAITKHLVDTMEGSIDITSTPGQGTTCHVALPLEITEAVSDTACSNENSSIMAGAKILLAEDNDLNYEIAEELLSDIGLKITRAVNGKECVKLFIASGINYYDLIFMDIRMPEMDGIEATRAIRALPREDAGTIPIVAMSADAFADDVQRSLNAGMNDHISKPLDMKLVRRVLEKELYKAAGQGEQNARF